MFDRIFSAALTFSLLAAGTLAVGSEFIRGQALAAASAPVRVVHLPTVEIVGHRSPGTLALASASAAVPAAARVE